MGEIVWQYSEEWMRQEGIFDKSSRKPKSEIRPPAPIQPSAPNKPPTPEEPRDSDEEDDVEPRPVDPSGFVPAENKLEAVNRISRIAGGGPEILGPGSTERKSVLEILATALSLPGALLRLSKPALGEKIADRLGQPWGDGCWSRGSTVTLMGLNRLLEGAERELQAAHAEASSPTEEAGLILNILDDALPRTFDGKSCILEMKNGDSSKWAMTEWQGWYFEYVGISACIGSLGGGPVASPGRTVFDYGRTFTWDFKAHSVGSGTAILNDQSAIDWAMENGGLGFLVLHGAAEFDPAFASWFSKFKLDEGKVRRSEPSSNPRRLKSSFTPERIDAFYFSDPDAWASAKTSGAVVEHRQGRQPSGQSRNLKYGMSISAARTEWLVGEVRLG